ncbi:MAG: DUF6089 family protein [Bacteroidota bacterium]
MNAIARVTLFFVLIAAPVSTLHAQKSPYQFEAGINLGTFVYQGDLVSSFMGTFKGTRPMVQLWVGKPFTPFLSWRANIAFGSLSADESQFSSPYWKQIRNFAFNTPVTEFTGLLQYNIYGDNGKETYHTLTPYLMGGLSITCLNIRRDWSKLDKTGIDPESPFLKGLTNDSLKILPGVLPVLPLGAGLRLQVSPRLAVNTEALFRFSLSDYIDGFSYAANPKAKDGYYSVSLGVSFSLGENGGSVRCPRIKY